MQAGQDQATMPQQNEVEVRSNQYREMRGINQSLLKTLQYDLHKAVRMMNNEEEATKSYFTLGSAIEDELMGVPSKLKVLDISLSDALQTIADKFHTLTKDSKVGQILSTEQKMILLDVIKEEGWNNNWKDETKINNAWNLISRYVLVQSQLLPNQTIVSAQEFSMIQEAVQIIKRSPYAYLFNPNDEEIKQRYKIMYQIPINWMISIDDKSEACKGLIDILVIDLVDKTMRIIDLKTTHENPYKAQFIINRYRYDFQLSFYQFGLAKLGKVMGISLENYTLLNPQILFLPKKQKLDSDRLYQPLMVEMTTEDIQGAELGCFRHGVYYQGWRQALSNFIWHKKNNDWSNRPDVVNNDNTLLISL